MGRAIRREFPNARIDGVDRDVFLTSICTGANRRDGVPGKIVADLKDDGWQGELSSGYDVVATVNAVHWFDLSRAEQLVRDVHALLRGGVFLLAEPVSPEAPFVAGFEAWKAAQPARYSRENWQRFWSRANALLGYDHVELLGPRPVNRIDDGMTVAGWTGLLRGAGFVLTDVLLQDADPGDHRGSSRVSRQGAGAVRTRRPLILKWEKTFHNQAYPAIAFADN